MSGRDGGFAALRGPKVMVLGALVAGALVVGVGPAAAHEDDGPSWRHEQGGWGERDRWREEQRRQEEWRERQIQQEREARREQRERDREAWRREKWREHHGWSHGAAYGAPPAVVYAPAPYGVYAPPARSGFEFSVNIPIR
ncbi:hypothetical protein [Azospirillum sp.]|uniref:hypothetical protein n=1 Tax=Azospirillum sp. TaxID=34012 RepID=UPI003D715502